MEYVRLGASGLKVSRLCIGCMSFGGMKSGYFAWTLGLRGGGADNQAGRSTSGSTSSTRRTCTPRAGPRRSWDRAIKGRRDDLVIATKVYNPMGPGPERQGALQEAHPPRGQALARAARHRLHRPLPDTPVGLRGAHRGDADDPERPRQGRAVNYSAPRACGRGSSPRRSTSARGSASRSSSACRTTTTSPTGRRRGR